MAEFPCQNVTFSAVCHTLFMKHTLQVRLPSRFEEFLSQNHFRDVTITSNGRSYYAHRILLAKHCGWFRRAFENASGENLPIEIPEDPGEVFGSFLKFLYTGQIDVTDKNIVELLKVAVVLDCESFKRAMHYLVRQIADEENVLELCERLTKQGMTDDALELADKAANVFMILMKSNDTEFAKVGKTTVSMNTVIESLAPRVFAKTLRIANEKERMEDIRKVELIDRYAQAKAVTCPQDQEELACLIDWKDPQAYTYLIQFKCDWVPPKYTRHLFTKILTYRQATVKAFRSQANKVKGSNVSRWFVAGWCTALSEAKKCTVKFPPKHDIFKFVTTLGGVAKSLDPLDFGFLDFKSTVNPLSPDFGPHQFLKEGGYWMCKQANHIPPALSVSLKAGQFKVYSLAANQNVEHLRRRLYRGARAPQMLTDELIVRVGKHPTTSGAMVSDVEIELTLRKSTEYRADVNNEGSYCTVAVEFRPNKITTFQGDQIQKAYEEACVYRLESISVEGTFTAE